MIFYFTGTGNSLYVARYLGEKIFSIPQVLKKTELSFVADTIGIVCPIYGHEMPEMVKKFIRKAEFKTEYFYVILTYGAHHGGAAELAEKFISECGKRADYITTIEMVDNFLPVFDMNEEMKKEKHIETRLKQIKEEIKSQKEFIQSAGNEREIHEKYLLRATNASPAIWSRFIVSDECIGCGICAKICPGKCIHLENQHAVREIANCQACYACIHACPKMAIQFELPEKNKNARYRNEHVSLCDLIQANNQMED